MKRVQFFDGHTVYAAHADRIPACLSQVAELGSWIFADQAQGFARDVSGFCRSRLSLLVADGTDTLKIALRTLIPTVDPNNPREDATVPNAGAYTTNVLSSSPCAARWCRQRPAYLFDIAGKSTSISVLMDSMHRSCAPLRQLKQSTTTCPEF